MSTTQGRRECYLNSNEVYNRSMKVTNNLPENLRNVINNKRTMHGSELKVPKSAVIETVRPELDSDGWEMDKENCFEMVSSEALTSSIDTTSSEAPVIAELVVRLHQCLRRSQDDSLGGRRILMPADMLPRLAKEILLMSQCEPYGIRGVLVNVSLEQRDKTIALGKVESTSYVAATFVVNITLKEDESRWFTIRDFVLGGLLGRKELYLSPGYKIEKEKLYRSSSPTLS